MKIELAKNEIIHFVGIGGIGMSGLSLIMKSKGFRIQGSDISLNKNIERLKKEKIKIFIGHKKQNLKKATIVVISSAIKKNNPELLEAKKKNLPVIKRGKMLAHIVTLMKNIVVVGSHGKTTTTSLIASIFQKTKLDPTIINGGVINSIKSFLKRCGLSKSIVVFSLLLISDNIFFLSLFFFGRNPSKINFEAVKPLDKSAVKAADGPGIQIVSKLCIFAFLTRSSPGSQMLGIPASLTSATDLPSLRKLIIFGILCNELCLLKLVNLLLIFK